MYLAGLDKCGRSVTVNTIRLHMGTAHMACNPGRGGRHDQKGRIGNIIEEAPEGGRAYARGAGDIVQRSRWDVQRHVRKGAAGPILRRGGDFRRGVILGVCPLSRGAILRDSAFSFG